MATENDYIDEFLKEKFPETNEQEAGEDYSNPMTASNQVKAAKELFARKNPSTGEKFRRLKAGKGFQ